MQINWFNESTPTATETNVSNIGIAFNWICLLICSRLCQLNLNIFVLSLFRAPYNRNHFKKAMNETKKIQSSKSHTLVKRLSDRGHPSRANGTVFCMPFPPKNTSVPFPMFFFNLYFWTAFTIFRTINFAIATAGISFPPVQKLGPYLK